MNLALLLAAALLVLIGFIHSILGEHLLLRRLLRPDRQPPVFGGNWLAARTLRFAWHVTTLAWWGFAAVLALMARGTPTQGELAWVVCATFGVTGLLALVASRGRHLSWIVFFAVAGLMAGVGWHGLVRGH